MKIKHTEEFQLREGRRVLLGVTLDIPYHDFLRIVKAIPRPQHKPKPHHETVHLRVRATRPDGSTIEPFAGISFVNGKAGAILSFSDISSAELPVDTKIELLRFETQAQSGQ